MAAQSRIQRSHARAVAQAGISRMLKAEFDPIAREPLPGSIMALLVRSEFKATEERLQARVERLKGGLKQTARTPKGTE